MNISSAFDGGNIQVVDISDPGDIHLRIRPDVGEAFFQWFYFRLSGARDQDCRLIIDNAGEASYPRGFEGYQAVASHDRQHWFRVGTDFDGRALTIRHRPPRDSVYYAYFAPYSMERHHDLMARCLESSRCHLTVPGQTLDGQDLDLLRIGEPGKGKRQCWVIARQHPGETMASWWMEGFLARLLDPLDPVAASLLERAVFHVVPNMNPDGSRRGHLRTNAVGTNLNREWQNPSLERSPEVALIREQMYQTGVDFCLDVHGDEALPYNFIAGFEGIPSLNETQLSLLTEFRTRLAALCPDFQTVHGYPRAQPGKANLSTCTNYLAEHFGCLAMTLEQPFKDAANHPMPGQGWSPGRCGKLAHACLDALHPLLEKLR